MLTCVGVANSSMNPDPEPVHAGPIQVFIMAGQPACVQVPYLSIWCPSHHSKWVDSLPPHTTAWLPGGADSACCWLRLRECVLGRVGGHENKSLIPRLSTRRPVQHGGVRLGSMVKKCPIGRGRGVVVPPPPSPSPACAVLGTRHSGAAMSGLGTSKGGGRYNGDVFVSCAKYQLALSSPPSRSTLQASDQPLVTASHRVQSATSRNTLRHIKKSRMRRRLASASLTTAKKTARMAAAASREAGTL